METPETPSTETLVTQAAQGNAEAWHHLVTRYERLVWSVPRSHRLPQEDAADVFQTTWLRLSENLTRLTHPHRLPAWLITTARHESLRTLRRQAREHPTPTLPETPLDLPTPEDEAVTRDTRSRLWQAFTTLSTRCQQILRLMAFAPDLPFRHLAEAVGIPANSLGPTRQRCLDTLRRRLTAEPA
ncbi:sigma-70 family RNA polymerase sigma factor [Actinosynnema sp. NPDC020468]|uniref:RNA polymerase sigma factor n=1 Tax=Actinosynnema sp. NPDC020468 TaxID=3154488 RepID=UPI0033DCAF6B